MEQLYDVVFFGLQPDKDSAKVAQAIATAFGIPLDKAEALLKQPSGALIKKNVPATTAEQFQTRLTNAGVKANYKPSASSATKLELVPMKEKETVSQCPACNKPVENDDNGERPLICPHCHIVFAKFEQNRQRYEEEKQIRERLERMQHIQSAEQERKRQQEEEETRKKNLEENIRKQLGLAKVINTPTGLISSATLLLFLGLGLGVVVSKLFLSEPQQLPPSDAAPALAAAGGLDLETLASTANQIAAAQTAAGAGADAGAGPESPASDASIAAAVADATAAADAENGAAPPDESPAAAQQLAQDATQTVTETPSAPPPLGISPAQDLEWDAYLLSQVQTSVAQDALAQATRLAVQINDIPMRYQAQIDIVLGYQRLGQRSAADALLNSTLQNIATTPSLMRRIELATDLVPQLVRANQPILAASALAAIDPWLNAIQAPGELAQAWARKAWAEAWLGFTQDSNISLQRAVATLSDPMSATARIQAMSQLAAALFQGDARADAENILAQARTLAEDIESPQARNEALASLARTWVQGGDLPRAVDMAQGLSAAQRDAVLLDVLQQQALGGQSFGLASVAEMIATPVAQARAYAMLGRTSADARIGEAHFQHAESISGRLKDEALMQVLLLGEIARYRSRVSGQADFTTAEARLQGLVDDPRQEQGWELLMLNAARARDLAAAQRYLAQIKTPRVAARARGELAQVQQALAAMPGGS
ncbi:hypothetical protein CKO36_04600 [Rhabdochromatium marinum]|nr:hypothetical protein [Rhabdochromatium marinum]